MDETRTEQRMELDHSLIIRMIPHRYPFLMVDKVIDVVAGESAVGIKNVTVNEPHFQGHFPDQPVMPGVAIVESMAQSAALLVNYTEDLIDKPINIYLLGVDEARFRRMVVPGDVLELRMEVLRRRGKVWRFQGKAYVGENLAAEAVITALWEPAKDKS